MTFGHIMQVPMINTCHLKEDTVNGYLKGTDSLLVADYDFGSFIYIGEAEDDLPVDAPEDLKALARFVRAQGEFYWVRIDGDGDVIEGLPEYEW